MLRSPHGLGASVWKKGMWAQAANEKAGLSERRKQCAEAHKTLMEVIAKASLAAGVRLATIANEALRGYWLQQKRTRVVSRILRGLPKAA